jgi:hypothetical protein
LNRSVILSERMFSLAHTQAPAHEIPTLTARIFVSLRSESGWELLVINALQYRRAS